MVPAPITTASAHARNRAIRNRSASNLPLITEPAEKPDPRPPRRPRTRRSSSRQRGQRTRAGSRAGRDPQAAGMWAGLSRKGPRRAPAPLSVVVLDERGLEELGPELRIRFVVSPPERGPCPRVALAHASHLRAQVHRVEVHRNTVRLKDTHELVSDLDTDALLDGETPCEYPHQPGQLGDPDDLFVGDVSDVRMPVKRQCVMLAE